MLQEGISMENGENIDNNEESYMMSSYMVDDVVHCNTSTKQPIVDAGILIDNDHMVQNLGGQYTWNISIPMQDSVQDDIIYMKANNQLPERIRLIEMMKTSDEQRLPICPDRCSTESGSSNNGQAVKLSIEMIDKQTVFLPDEHASLSNRWHLYRIQIKNSHDLGFVIPFKLVKPPIMDHCENEDVLKVQWVYVGSIDYKEYEDQQKDFHQYLVEDVFCGVNTNLGLPFELLPCVLKQTGEIDYQRMASICSRNNKLVQNSTKTNDQEVHDLFNPLEKQFIMCIPTISVKNSEFGSSKDPLMTGKRPTEDPSGNLSKKFSPMGTGKLNGSSTSIYHSSHAAVRYASLNSIDRELIDKVPNVFSHLIQKLRKLLDDTMESRSSLNIGQAQMADEDDSLHKISSLSQSNILPLGSLNYDFLSSTEHEHEPLFDSLISQVIKWATAERLNMHTLATLGDSLLKLIVSISLYCRPLYDSKLKTERDRQVSNRNLCRLAKDKNLKSYFPVNEINCGKEESIWLPSDYKMNKDNPDKCSRKTSQYKPPADRIEALIGGLSIRMGYPITIKFMHWLGLDAIPVGANNATIKLPSIRRATETNNLDETYNKDLFMEIETKLNYNFQDKAYLIAAYTHPSRSDNAVTINYERLRFVGNPLFEYLLTWCTFVTLKLTTSDHITDVRQDILDRKKNLKGAIMVVNNLHTKIICSSSKLFNPINDNQSTDLKIPEAVCEVFDAIIAAIFFDSNCSLKAVWDVIEPMLRRHINLDQRIKNPDLNPVRWFDKQRDKTIQEYRANNGDFVCRAKLPDGSEAEGIGKSKEVAKESACMKLKDKFQCSG